MREQVIDLISKEKIIAIVRGYSEEECLSLAKALCAGGVHLMEVTFHQTDKEEQQRLVTILKRLNAELGDKMCFGAGTVTDVHMVDMAQEAGCRFIVSPDTDEDVIRETVKRDMVSIPGALTPTEIKQACKYGADYVKVFPANRVGPAYFKDVHAPLSQAKMLAVGGVNAENAPEYFKAGAVGAGVAGCLFTKDQIKNGEWDKITAAAEKLCAALR